MRFAGKILASPRLRILLALCTAALVGLVLAGFGVREQEHMEARLDDLVWRHLVVSSGADERRIVVLDIDEKSVAKLGPWPWPRSRVASLVDRLAEAQVGQLVLDIVFPGGAPGDADLARAFGRLPVVHAQVFSLQPGVTPNEGAIEGGAGSCAPSYPHAVGHIANAPSLPVVAAGHITPRIDSDGIIRRIPAFVCQEGVAYPALALAALQRAADGAGEWRWAPARGLASPAAYVYHDAMPGMRIPLDVEGNLTIPYRLPRSAFKSISAIDLLEGRVPQELLKGAWIVMGSTAFGGTDAVSTPLAGLVGGAEVHAQLLVALLDGTIPHRPEGGGVLQVIFCVIFVLPIVGLALRGGYGAFVVALVALPLALLPFAAHIYLLDRQLVLVPWLGSSAFLLLAGIFVSAVEHARQKSETERVFSRLATYLPATAAREAASRARHDHIDAHTEILTVLCADLRNFSRWCERLSPDASAAILHVFFTQAAQAVEQTGGEIQEFIGDALLATWRGPEGLSRALQAAERIHASSLAPESGCPVEREDHLPPLGLGVGIEAGAVLTGSIGSANRRVHVILGDTVTRAIRLQSMTAELAQPTLIGPRAKETMPDYPAQCMGQFLLDGVSEAIAIYAAPPNSERSGTSC